MPMMISLQRFLLSTTTGHMIRFEPNTPVFVPDEAVAEAMSRGCAPADPAARPFFDEIKRQRVEFNGPLRSSLLVMAISDVVRENSPRSFDGAGLPKVDAIQKRLGFEIFKPERAEAFRVVMSAKKSNETVPLHPNAKVVYDILRAETKEDLEKYVEAGDELARGLTTTDLRKHLLVQYSGIAPVG